MATYKYQSNKWDDWMKDTLNGDQASYRKLLSDLHPWLVAYFGKRLNGDEAEDLAQDTLLSLHNKRSSFDPAQPFGPWISAIARYRLIDYVRKLQRNQGKDTEFNEDYDKHGHEGNIDGKIINNLELKHLMQELTAEQYEVIDLVKLQEYSIKEAAEKTGHSESSVKVMIHRGTKKMKEKAQEIEKQEQNRV